MRHTKHTQTIKGTGEQGVQNIVRECRINHLPTFCSQLTLMTSFEHEKIRKFLPFNKLKKVSFMLLDADASHVVQLNNLC